MTLGLVKSYTPSASQVGSAAGYNTDIAALFNAFSGLEAQTATLGGLTITPTANSTATFNVTNAAGTSIFSVDTTNSLVKYKTASIVAQNITSVRLTTDFTTATGAYDARTGGQVTITTVKASAKVLVMLHSTWMRTASGTMFVRLNQDSGTYINLGSIYMYEGYGYEFNPTVLLTGLTAAAHTIDIEFKVSGSTISNLCTDTSLYNYELIAMEI